MHPKISIITATYNSVKTLEQTILSVVGQTYSSIEYIIIDGGSTDGTVDLLKKYNDKIAYWISEPDEGIYDAFNKGVAHATGDYVQFLGSDDCLCNEFVIEKIANEIEISVDILCAGVWVVDEINRLQFWATGLKAIEEGYDYTMIPHQGMFTRRNLLLKHPFDVSYRIVADYLFFLTCYYDEKVHFKYIETPVAFFSMGGFSGELSVLLQEENNRVRTAFGLPLLEDNKSLIKETIKDILKRLRLFEPTRYILNRYVRKNWRIHQCSWPSCRWCHR